MRLPGLTWVSLGALGDLSVRWWHPRPKSTPGGLEPMVLFLMQEILQVSNETQRFPSASEATEP